MSENKTEQATEAKLKKAAEEGQISRSKDLSSAASLLCAVSFLTLWANEFWISIESFFKHFFTFNKESLNQNFEFHLLSIELTKILLSLLAPLLVIQIIIVPFVTFLVGGRHFNLVQIKPKLSKLNPIEGFKKIFSVNTFVELIKSVLKISCVFVAFYYTLLESIPKLTSLSRTNIDTSSDQISTHLLSYSSILILIIIIFALFDSVYQKHAFAKRMRMSKQDVKDEHKESEGRPEVKQRIRQIQASNAKRSINKTVPEANLILANPTHYSVAIKYDPTKAEAPFVVAKGIDDMALYIREVAAKSNVPVFEYPTLARAVYNTTSTEQMIPNQLFLAVAQVLGYFKQLEDYEKNKADKPTKPTNLNIPKELYENMKT